MKKNTKSITKENLIYFHYARPMDSPFIYKKIGLNIPTGVFYVADGASECFFVPALEYDYLKKYSKHKIIKNIKDISGSENNYFNAVIDFLKEKRGKIVVPALFPAWLFEKMIKNGIDVTVKESYFFQSVLHKDAEEIKTIRAVADGVKKCFKYVKNILSETEIRNNFIYYKGKRLSSSKLAEVIRLFLLERGIECNSPVIACGEYAYYPHCQVNHFFQVKEPIIIDLVARSLESGYCVDVSRTFCIGSPKFIKFLELYDCIIRAKSELEQNALPGKLISSAHNSSVKIMSACGIKMARGGVAAGYNSAPICYHSLGHGIGREVHQLPIIDERADVVFEKGMVLAFEPGAYVKGRGGVRVEDTYLITEKGAENLTSGSYNFLIKPK